MGVDEGDLRTAEARMNSVAESQSGVRLDSPRSHSRPPWPPTTASASAYVPAPAYLPSADPISCCRGSRYTGQ